MLRIIQLTSRDSKSHTCQDNSLHPRSATRNRVTKRNAVEKASLEKLMTNIHRRPNFGRLQHLRRRIHLQTNGNIFTSVPPSSSQGFIPIQRYLHTPTPVPMVMQRLYVSLGQNVGGMRQLLQRSLNSSISHQCYI